MRSTKKTSPAKPIIIALIILALLVAAFFAARKVRVSNTNVTVSPVRDLSWGYVEDEMSMDGMVYDEDSQTIYYDASLIVNEVFVEEGQSVKEGDNLIQYDMESEQLAYQMAQLNLNQLKNDLTAANAELRALYNTTPVPEYVPPEPSPDDTPEPIVDPTPDPVDEKPEKEQIKDAWNYLDGDSINDYYLDPKTIVINGATTQHAEDDTSADNSSGTDEDDDAQDSAADDEDDTDSSTDDNLYQVPPAGSIENPYRYLVTEDGVIYGSFLNELHAIEDSYAVVDIRAGNVIDGEIIASLTLNTNNIAEQNPDDHWYVILHTDEEGPKDGDEDGTDGGDDDTDTDDYDDGDEFEDIPTGYTAAELAVAIKDAQEQIRDLDIEIRRAELELKVMSEEMEDGIVRAKHGGVVTIAHDKNDPPQDGSPFIKIESGSGVTVQGTISELLLETIQTGQEITAYDWETSAYYTGEITKIDDYPADSRYYYSGNPNASFYGFLAYFDDAEGLEAGHYLQMSLDANANNQEILAIPNAYIRSDSQGKYVMKDEDGILTKQYIKCGKIYYAYVTEIIDGLSEEDFIAFPYGDGEEEGAKTTVSDENEEEYW